MGRVKSAILETQCFASPTIGSFCRMLGSDTRAMGRVLDVACYDLSVTQIIRVNHIAMLNFASLFLIWVSKPLTCYVSSPMTFILFILSFILFLPFFLVGLVTYLTKLPVL